MIGGLFEPKTEADGKPAEALDGDAVLAAVFGAGPDASGSDSGDE